MSKRLVDVSLSGSDGLQYREYTGRFLGLIKDDEFNALVAKAKEIASRLETKGDVPLIPLFMEYDELQGMRFVLAIKMVNGIACGAKKLFISERLDWVREARPEGRVVELVTADNKDITLVEKGD